MPESLHKMWEMNLTSAENRNDFNVPEVGGGIFSVNEYQLSGKLTLKNQK